MYQYRDHKEAYELLRKAGFSHSEIDRLSKFRKDFAPGDQDQTPTEQRRLEFARWLFQTGKLNDYREHRSY